MPNHPCLRPGVVRTAAVATAVLAVLRALHVLVPTWWAVGLPALAVALAYAQVRVERWAAARRSTGQ